MGKIKWKNYLLYGGVAIFLILLIVDGLYLLSGRREAIDSISVISFENANENPDTGYLCDRITASLINKLSQLSSLKKVIARGSVFRYMG